MVNIDAYNIAVVEMSGVQTVALRHQSQLKKFYNRRPQSHYVSTLSTYIHRRDHFDLRQLPENTLGFDAIMMPHKEDVHGRMIWLHHAPSDFFIAIDTSAIDECAYWAAIVLPTGV